MGNFESQAGFPYQYYDDVPAVPPRPPRGFPVSLLFRAVAQDPDALSASFGMATDLVKGDFAGATAKYDKLEDDKKAWAYIILALEEWSRQWLRYEANWVAYYARYRNDRRMLGSMASKQSPPPEMLAACQTIGRGRAYCDAVVAQQVATDGRVKNPW